MSLKLWRVVYDSEWCFFAAADVAEVLAIIKKDIDKDADASDVTAVLLDRTAAEKLGVVFDDPPAGREPERSNVWAEFQRHVAIHPSVGAYLAGPEW